MTIFNQIFLLEKINTKCFTKNLPPQNHCQEAERLWQSPSLKLVSLNLFSSLQYQLFPNYQKSSINSVPGFLSFKLILRGGDIFST